MQNEKSPHSHIWCVSIFLQNYLSSRGKSWKDLRQEALQNIEQGKYHPTGKPACLIILKLHMQQRWQNWASAFLPGDAGFLNLSLSDFRISGSTIMCFCCGLRALADLAYKYRQSIPSSELPGCFFFFPSFAQCYTSTRVMTEFAVVSFFSCCNSASRLLLGSQLSHSSEGTSCNVSSVCGSWSVQLLLLLLCTHFTTRRSPCTAWCLTQLRLEICEMLNISFSFFPYRKFNHICEQTRFKSWRARWFVKV